MGDQQTPIDTNEMTQMSKLSAKNSKAVFKKEKKKKMLQQLHILWKQTNKIKSQPKKKKKIKREPNENFRAKQ